MEQKDDSLALDRDVTTQLDDPFVLVVFSVQLMLVAAEEFDDGRVLVHIGLVLFAPRRSLVCPLVSSS